MTFLDKLADIEHRQWMQWAQSIGAGTHDGYLDAIRRGMAREYLPPTHWSQVTGLLVMLGLIFGAFFYVFYDLIIK